MTTRKNTRTSATAWPFFLDIDGTLLPPGDMLIPESTLAALDRARANGHKLFFVHRTQPPHDRNRCCGTTALRAQCAAPAAMCCAMARLWWISPWSRSRLKACARHWNAMAWSALAQSQGRGHVHPAAFSDYKGNRWRGACSLPNHERPLVATLLTDQFVFCESKLDRLTDGFVNGELINRKSVC